VTTFGEIMLRLSPPRYQRFVQSAEFEVVYGGAEANVAISLAWLGIGSEFVTRLPDNEMGRVCVQSLRQHAVGTQHTAWGGSRLGIYFLETGAAQRNTNVIYDRANSSFADSPIDTYDWPKILSQSDWFHWSGITPAVSENTSLIMQKASTAAGHKGIIVSCDLNYRSKLWKWGKAPNDVMPGLVEHCHLLVAGMHDAAAMLGINIPEAGDMFEKQASVFRQISKRFPGLNTIATTLRTDTTSSKTTIQGLMWHNGSTYTSKSYSISQIVDRVGSGDAFSAGLIHGFLKNKDPEAIIEFATAAACLKHSIAGDANLVTEDEILALVNSGSVGRVSR